MPFLPYPDLFLPLKEIAVRLRSELPCPWPAKWYSLFTSSPSSGPSLWSGRSLPTPPHPPSQEHMKNSRVHTAWRSHLNSAGDSAPTPGQRGSHTRAGE